jgi:hypothetical protein
MFRLDSCLPESLRGGGGGRGVKNENNIYIYMVYTTHTEAKVQ